MYCLCLLTKQNRSTVEPVDFFVVTVNVNLSVSIGQELEHLISENKTLFVVFITTVKPRLHATTCCQASLTNQLNVCIHDTAGCTTGCGCTTGLTTGCIV